MLIADLDRTSKMQFVPKIICLGKKIIFMTKEYLKGKFIYQNK